MNGDPPMMAFRKSMRSCIEYVFPYHFPTRDQFLASYLRQCFSLPDSIMYYILKNPSSSKVYQKLIQSSKYFFIKNPILVLHCLQIDEDGGWKRCSNDCDDRKPVEKANIRIRPVTGCKIWIEDLLHIFSTNSNYASDFVTNIYRCDAEKLYLRGQNLNHHQFFFYSHFTNVIKLENAVIYSDADSEMPIEDIANLPNIERFVFDYDPESLTNVSTNFLEKLIQIPHFKNIKFLSLFNISEDFDIDRFYNYSTNQNPGFLFFISYHNLPSEEYAKKLDKYIDKMLTFVLRGDIYNPKFDQIYLLMPWIFDALHLSRPFLLIFICKQMRNAFASAMKTKKFVLNLGEDESITEIKLQRNAELRIFGKSINTETQKTALQYCWRGTYIFIIKHGIYI